MTTINDVIDKKYCHASTNKFQFIKIFTTVLVMRKIKYSVLFVNTSAVLYSKVISKSLNDLVDINASFVSPKTRDYLYC